ncbi:MAG: PAS domain S-box protein, partial [Ignavibacteriae bacterium]|nr:PAS domain S-box protein [Ignavibacteriota bacterium]
KQALATTNNQLLEEITKRKESEEHLRQLVEYSPIAMSITDTKTNNILFLNKKFKEWFGYTIEEIPNISSWWPLAYPEDEYRTRIFTKWKNGIEHTLKYQTEFKPMDAIVTCKDGSKRWIEFRSITLGDVTFTTFTDFTERKQAEEKLFESEVRYRNIVENLRQAYYEADSRSLFTYCNPGLMLISGYSEKELLQMSSFRLVADEHRKNISNRYNQWKKEKRTDMSVKFIVRKKNGEKIWVEQTTHFEFNEHGDLVKATNIVRDIDERKQAEEIIRTSERHKISLLNISKRLQLAQSFSQVLDDTLDEITNIVGYNSLWAYLLSEDGNTVSLIEGTGEVTEIGKKEVPVVNIKGDKIFEDVFSSDTPVLVEDARTDPRTNKDIVAVLQNRTILLVPMILADKKIGALGTGSFGEEGVMIPDTKQIEYFNAVASYVSVAFARIQILNERLKLEETLRANEQKYRSLFEHMVQGFAYCKMMFEEGQPVDWVYLSVNEVFSTLTGLRDVVGKRVTEIIPHIRKTDYQLFEIYSRVSLTGKAERFEMYLEALKMWFSISVYSPQKEYFVAIFDVITERKQTEEALRLSEEKYRSVVNSIKEIIFQTDAHGLWTFLNNVWCEITGFSVEESLGTLFLQYVHPDDRQRNLDYFQPLIERKKEYSRHEIRYLTKDGRYKWIEVFAKLIVDEENNVSGTSGTLTDITERKLTEEALQRSEDKYRDIVTWAPIGIYQSTIDGKFITANSRLAEMLGYSSIEELLGCNIADDIYHQPDERERLLSEYANTKNSSVANHELLWKKKNGIPIWISLSTHAVKNKEGKTLYFEGFVYDITERKKMEAERKSLEAQLVQTQKLEAIGTLASGIAHDFNNILGIILGYNSLMRNGSPENELIEKSSGVIEGAVNRGAGLVKQILTFARQTETHFGPLDVNIISKEISKMLAETFPKTIVINLDLEKNLPIIIADPTQIHQVFLNLLVNARDAISSSGTLTIITRRTFSDEMSRHFQNIPQEDYLLVSIADTGCGMGEETKHRIFEPFFTTKEKGKGTGLGLSVVYGILKSHNGFIRVESTLGKGTTFFLYFPVPKKTDVQESEQIKETERIAGGTETVLLVEDELTLSELTKAFLEMYGYRVYTAKDGEEAIALYRQQSESIDIVVTDMGLPKLTGLEVLIEMKKVKPETKLIFASGFIEQELKSLMFRHGAKFFLYKPFQPVDILKVIRNILDSN